MKLTLNTSRVQQDTKVLHPFGDGMKFKKYIFCVVMHANSGSTNSHDCFSVKYVTSFIPQINIEKGLNLPNFIRPDYDNSLSTKMINYIGVAQYFCI